MSVKIFGKLLYLKNASLLMQFALGNFGFQLAAKGLHEESPVMTVDIVRPTRIPRIIQAPRRIFLVGKRRRYSARMATLGMLTLPK